jgi:hypothetical protein
MDPADGCHPDSERLEHFMRGKLSRSEVITVVRHLLTDCPRCLVVTRRLWLLRARAPRGLLALAREAATVGYEGCRRGVL